MRERPAPRCRCGASGSQTSASIEHPEASPSQHGGPPLPLFQPRTIRCRNTPFPPKGATAAEGHRTRRAALRALAGASALALPTIGSIADVPADPIFTAIERHKAACNAREATSFPLDDLMNNPDAPGVSDAEWDACDRARATEDAAFDELLTRVPTTAAGMRAALAHFISFDDGRFSEKMRRFLATLVKSPLFVA
jgi:hypothetical protein